MSVRTYLLARWFDARASRARAKYNRLAKKAARLWVDLYKKRGAEHGEG